MICLRVSLSSLESIHPFYYSLATRVSRDLTPWLVRQYGAIDALMRMRHADTGLRMRCVHRAGMCMRPLPATAHTHRPQPTTRASRALPAASPASCLAPGVEGSAAF